MKSGRRRGNKSKRGDTLTLTERVVLEHIATHMLTVKAVWATSGDLAAFDAKAISKTIKRLVRRGLIEVGWLHHGTHYFVLARRAARHLQSRKSVRSPFRIGQASRLWPTTVCYAVPC